MNFEPQRAGRNRPAHLLVGDALHQSADLLHKEAELFRAEMATNVSRLIGGVGLLLGGTAFAVVAISLLVGTAVEWLAVELDSRWMASAICAGITALIAIILFAVGRNRVSLSTLAPTRTLRSLEEDGEMLSRKVTS